MVDIKCVKSADIPLGAQNQLEENMIHFVHLHHGEQADDAHLPHGEGDEAPVQEVSPVKQLPTTKIMNVDEEIPDKDLSD